PPAPTPAPWAGLPGDCYPSGRVLEAETAVSVNRVTRYRPIGEVGRERVASVARHDSPADLAAPVSDRAGARPDRAAAEHVRGSRSLALLRPERLGNYESAVGPEGKPVRRGTRGRVLSRLAEAAGIVDRVKRDRVRASVRDDNSAAVGDKTHLRRGGGAGGGAGRVRNGGVA